MATYEELSEIFIGESATKNRVKVAVVVSAIAIRDEDGGTVNHANRLIWAKEALQDPAAKMEEMWPAILASNKDNTILQIKTASDVNIQAAVDACIDLFATG